MFATRYLGRALILGGFIAASSVLAVSDAEAAPTLRLTTGGGTTVTVADESAGDIAIGVPGAVTFSGAIGDFLVQVTVGTTKPAVGTATNPLLKISNTSVNIVSPGADTLTIEFSDTDFVGGGQSLAINTIGGDTAVTGGGTVSELTSFEAFIDSTNTLFGTGTQVANLGPLSSSPFSGIDQGGFDLGAGPVNYSITQKFVITAGTQGSNISFDATTRVPMPATFGLLGVALFGLGVAMRRRRA